MEPIQGDLAQIMHDIRPEGASYVVIVDARKDGPVEDYEAIEAAHGPFDDWAEAMEWAVENEGTVIPLFPRKEGT
jgi:hypothetical protein